MKSKMLTPSCCATQWCPKRPRHTFCSEASKPSHWWAALDISHALFQSACTNKFDLGGTSRNPRTEVSTPSYEWVQIPTSDLPKVCDTQDCGLRCWRFFLMGSILFCIKKKILWHDQVSRSGVSCSDLLSLTLIIKMCLHPEWRFFLRGWFFCVIEAIELFSKQLTLNTEPNLFWYNIHSFCWYQRCIWPHSSTT